MLGHTLGFLYVGEYSNFLSFLGGFFGVELFFVLSGVLIGKILIEILQKTNFTLHLKNFVLRRWLRTLPLYFIMLIVYWVINYFFNPVQIEEVPLWKYLFFLQNFTDLKPMIFGVSWSLSIEEWFYIGFPALLLLLKSVFSKLEKQKLILLVISFFILLSLLIRILFFSTDFNFYEGARKITLYRLDSIAFGVLGAFGFYYFKEKLKKYRYHFLILGLVLLITNQYIISKDQYSHIFYFNTLYYSVLGLSLVLLFPFFKELRLQNGILKKCIIWISKISYSLYLIHWIVFKSLDSQIFDFAPNLVKFVLFIAISIVLASITYVWIEKPILKFRDKIVHQ